MSQDNKIPAELADLFADFDASFGKAAAKKAAAANKPSAKPKAPVVNSHLAESRTANTLRALLESNSVWKPVAVTAQIVEQTCRCCGSTTKYLGNTLITHEHRRTRVQWSAQLPVSPEHTNLPHEIAYHSMQVEQCPTCIEFTLRVTELAEVPANLQLSLFN